jgi:predicted phosphodiesterase
MPAACPLTKTATDLVRKHPRQPARSLARMLVKRSRGALTVEAARCRIRRIIGQSGKAARKKAAHPRPARAPGEGLPMPKTKAKPRTPYRMPVVGRIGILSDIHVPYHSNRALAAAVSYLQGRGIDGLLLNGDFADFYSISRWEKNPAERDLAGELQQVRAVLGWLRQSFPTIPIVAKTGNHEERWEAWLFQHAPEISAETAMGLRAWLHLDKHNIELVENRRIVMAGKLPILHGHELPRGQASPVNQARGAYVRTNHSVMVGHGHRTSSHAQSNLWHDEACAWSTGCLCDLSPDYASVANQWNWGFAIVDVAKGGTYSVENFRIAKDGSIRTS